MCDIIEKLENYIIEMRKNIYGIAFQQGSKNYNY